MNAVDNDFFNFDRDIVNDLVNQGFEGQSLINEAEKENVGSVSKSDFDAIINL